jgi:aspartate 1-decarboxylase
MFLKMLKSKLHCATVTDAQVEYTGSIAIDTELMAAAEILPYETVLVADLDNGSRLETYAVAAPGGSGQIVVLGAAARLIKPGDKIIIFSFTYCTPQDAEILKPKIIILDDSNKIINRK